MRIGGGPTVARDFIAAGLVDHIHVVQVPIVLGRGAGDGFADRPAPTHSWTAEVPCPPVSPVAPN